MERQEKMDTEMEAVRRAQLLAQEVVFRCHANTQVVI